MTNELEDVWEKFVFDYLNALSHYMSDGTEKYPRKPLVRLARLRPSFKPGT
jgi:hypothetical protein